MSSDDPRLAPYNFELPEGAIARFPPTKRDGGRLLSSEGGRWCDRQVTDLVDAFEPGEVLVVNNTRVLSARLYGHRSTGGSVEVLLLGGSGEQVFAMVRPARRLKKGETIELLDRDGGPSEHSVVLGPAESDGRRLVRCSTMAMTIMDACGVVPLPPYLERPATDADAERYQTVFADQPGAIAAPTASLHLSEAVVAGLREKGVLVETVTLHVGPGTFRNLRPEDLDRGRLHTEQFEVSHHTAGVINEARRVGARVTAVGTTVTRALESASDDDGQVRPGRGETDLFIQPGFQFQVVDRLMTNFHLPKSSLLMLVCAFGGREHVFAGYTSAIELGFRFYSYGDAMLLEPAGESR
jgi:S-adenosylmethionine:tRNA ribosyltransferase-isomerase